MELMAPDDQPFSLVENPATLSLALLLFACISSGSVATHIHMFAQEASTLQLKYGRLMFTPMDLSTQLLSGWRTSWSWSGLPSMHRSSTYPQTTIVASNIFENMLKQLNLEKKNVMEECEVASLYFIIKMAFSPQRNMTSSIPIGRRVFCIGINISFHKVAAPLWIHAKTNKQWFKITLKNKTKQEMAKQAKSKDR